MRFEPKSVGAGFAPQGAAAMRSTNQRTAASTLHAYPGSP